MYGRLYLKLLVSFQKLTICRFDEEEQGEVHGRPRANLSKEMELGLDAQFDREETERNARYAPAKLVNVCVS